MICSVFAILLGLFFNGMRSEAEYCDRRYCYSVVGRVFMNNTNYVFGICQSTNPPSQLLSIYDSEIQQSVVNFFVSDLSAFPVETGTYVVLGLQKNSRGQWIWINNNTPLYQSFQNWKDGNPTDSIPGGDCAFFTPQESSKWWNALCSSKTVTVICMRAQDPEAFRTNSPQITTTTRKPGTTILVLTPPHSTNTVLTIPITTTTTTAAIETTIKTTTTTTAPPTSTTTTTTTTTAPPTSTTTTKTRPTAPPTSSTTTTTTTTTTSTTPSTTTTRTSIATNERLPQPSTNHSSVTTHYDYNLSSTTNSEPTHSDSVFKINAPSNSAEGEDFKKRLGIGIGVSFILVFIICLVTILVTYFFRSKNQKNSKFSSVIDIDHKKHYKTQNISPEANIDQENGEDQRSSDSGFDNEDAKSEPLQRMESTDVHSESNHDFENQESILNEDISENPEAPTVDSSIESGLDASAQSQYDWDYPTHASTGKKSVKKVSFDLEHVVEIPD